MIASGAYIVVHLFDYLQVYLTCIICIENPISFMVIEPMTSSKEAYNLNY